MTQTFRPTARANAVGLVLSVALATFCSIVGRSVGEVAFQFIAVVIVGAILFIRFRLRVSVSSETLSASGFFTSREVRFEEVVEVSWPGLGGSDFSGPFVGVLRTTKQQVRINFRFFDEECLRAVISRLPAGIDRNSTRSGKIRCRGNSTL